MRANVLPGPSPTRRVPRPSIGRWGVVGLLALALAGVAAPAHAHDSVTGTSPTDAEVLTVAPEFVSVEMSEDPQAIAPRMVVTATDGTVVVDVEPVLEGRVATAELPELANDTYQVAWRLVSSDGHPVQGVFSFTVDAPVAPSVEPSSAAPTTEAATTPPATTDAPVTATATASPTAAAVPGSADSGSWWAFAVVGVLGAGLALVVLLRRRTALKDPS